MTDLALKISSLEKKYASGVKALDGIDLEVKKGDFFALLGQARQKNHPFLPQDLYHLVL